MNRGRLHGTEKRLERNLDGRWHLREIVFKQCARQLAKKARGELAFGSGAGHQPVAPHHQCRRTLRLKFLRVLENNNAERRFQPEFRLPHNASEGETELLELAERLRGGTPAVVTDGFKGSEARFDPTRFGGNAARRKDGQKRHHAYQKANPIRHLNSGPCP